MSYTVFYWRHIRQEPILPTSGALYEVMLEGKKQQAGSYCDVRNAKLPPKEWHEAFNMKEYIWFDLFFCHMSTVN